MPKPKPNGAQPERAPESETPPAPEPEILTESAPHPARTAISSCAVIRQVLSLTDSDGCWSDEAKIQKEHRRGQSRRRPGRARFELRLGAGN